MINLTQELAKLLGLKIRKAYVRGKVCHMSNVAVVCIFSSSFLTCLNCNELKMCIYNMLYIDSLSKYAMTISMTPVNQLVKVFQPHRCTKSSVQLCSPYRETLAKKCALS